MHANLPCRHIPYVAWRRQVLESLYSNVRHESLSCLPFLHPKYLSSRSQTQRWIPTTRQQDTRPVEVGSDERLTDNASLKRQDVDHNDMPVEGNTTPEKKQPKSWSPFNRDGQKDMQELVESLKDMTKEAQERQEDEDVPFEDVPSESLFTPTKKMRKSSDDKGKTSNGDLPKFLTKSPLWKRRKPGDLPPKKRPTRNEAQSLDKNPWAQILASPIRMCQGSRARIPLDLYVDFSMTENPKDGQTYLIPNDLGDLEKLKKQLPSSGNPRPKIKRKASGESTQIRILPYTLLLQSLTDQLSSFDRKLQKPMTKPGLITKRLIPPRWKQAAETATAFRKASQDYFDVAMKSQPEAEQGRPMQEVQDFSRLQWKADTADRMLNIMRSRVLLALDGVGIGAQSNRKVHQRKVMALQISKDRTYEFTGNKLIASEGKMAQQEFWNDMGDIEEADAISGKRERTNKLQRPPIALQPSDFEQKSHAKHAEGNDILEQDDEVIDWLSGSFFLHIDPSSHSDTHTQHQEFETTKFTSLEPLPSSLYIPSMCTINDIYRLPVFGLDFMLGRHYQPILSGIFLKHKVFTLAFWEEYNKTIAKSGENQEVDSVSEQASGTLNPSNGGYLVLIKASAAGSNILLRELWQLWRYVGGLSFQELETNGNDAMSSSSKSALRLSSEAKQRMKSNLESTIFEEAPTNNHSI